MASPDHPPGDPNGKADVSGYQPGFLRDVGRAVAVGFEPPDEDPSGRESIDEADHDALWAQVGQ